MKKHNKSDKGNLVKGYIPPIPRGVLEFDGFKKGIKRMLKGNSGVYALYKDKNLYYVGISKDLFWRLGVHMIDKHGGKWNKFSAFIIGRGNYLKDIESMLHRISEIPANLAKGKFKGHYQYDHKIRRMVNEVAKTVKNIQNDF